MFAYFHPGDLTIAQLIFSLIILGFLFLLAAIVPVIALAFLIREAQKIYVRHKEKSENAGV